MKPERVWYLAYGSNLDGDRFQRYLSGGETEPGARDATPPRHSEWTTAPLQLCFAHESVRWDGGGVAFVNPDPEGQAIVRAWDITVEQFEDVFAQENRLDIPTPLDWSALLGANELTAGTGWYGRLLVLDVAPSTATQPAVTFTWTETSPARSPHESYLGTIRRGLDTHPNLSPAQRDAYLSAATIASS